MSRWPKDNQADLIAFYGDPADHGPNGVTAQLVRVIPPFKMYFEGNRVSSLRFHRKAAPALTAALAEIWRHYGEDQAAIDADGVSNYAGTFAPRKIRGSSSKWSNHAYGAAIDLNAKSNGFGMGRGNIPQAVIAAFKRQGARWGGDYKGRTDPMHFEFCYNGEPDIAPKPLVKSKIAQAATAVGVMAGGGTLNTISDTAAQVAAIKGSADQIGVFDLIERVLSSPKVVIGLAVLIAAGLIVYWRWRDHGKGQN